MLVTKDSSQQTGTQQSLQEQLKGLQVREVGSQAVWTLSSCKPGFGVEQLRDDNTDTYWQSDGPQPHLINVQFRKKTSVSHVAIYADFKADESYTPSRIAVRAGSHTNDLQDVKFVDFHEPCGWQLIELNGEYPGGPLGQQAVKSNCKAAERPVRAFLIQVAVVQNHQNGRDTHLRQVKVFSPMTDLRKVGFPQFSTAEMEQYVRFR